MVGILKNYFKVEHPTDKQIFFCLCLLYGWCCKIDTSFSDTNSDKIVLFCFLTGNVVTVQDSKISMPDSTNLNCTNTHPTINKFHPINSHYWWSPWREPELSKTFFDQLHGRKVSFSCDDDHNDTSYYTKPVRRILKRNSVASDCNNQEVQKFMGKLANIRRRKRRASQLERSNSLSPEEKRPVMKKSRSFNDIQDQIQECELLCLGSLRAFTPQADLKRKLERKRVKVLKRLFGDGN